MVDEGDSDDEDAAPMHHMLHVHEIRNPVDDVKLAG